MLATAALLWRRRVLALHVFAALVLGTVIWAWAEIGADWWPLVPRWELIFIFGALLALPWTVKRLTPGVRWARGAGPLTAAPDIAVIFGAVSLTRDVHNLIGLG